MANLPQQAPVPLDWETYLSQFDVVYRTRSRVWQDGLPLGNGSLGALAYEPFHPEWVINKNDVWDYRHPTFKRHTREEMQRIAEEDRDYVEEMTKENVSGSGLYPCPKTCGQLRIRFGHPSIYAPGHRTTKRLGLYEATLHTELDKHLSHPRIRSFICADRNVMVVSVRNVSAMTAFRNHVDLARTPDAQMPPCERGAEGDLIWLEQPFHPSTGSGCPEAQEGYDTLRFVLMAQVVPTRGEPDYADLFRQTVQEQWWPHVEPSGHVDARVEGEYAVAPVAGDFDIYLTVVTSLEASDPMAEARACLADAADAGVGRLHAAHRQWWADFWPASYVGLDDALLEQLWYVSLYNLASTLRGTPMPGLCGLWFGPMDTPSQILPWLGFYTNDYNTQLPVMPVFRANHPELADGAFRTLHQQLPGALRNAREIYGLPGAYYPLSADPTGEDVSNGPYRLCQGSGPYWGVLLWWHYLYTADVEHLGEVAYPLLKEVSTFFVEYMVWHEEESLYHLEISQNPELMVVKYPDPCDTLALLKTTLQATVATSELLDCDAELADRCRHVLAHYPPYARHGLEMSPLRGMPPNHMNHTRTLAALFPCAEFDPEAMPEWRATCLFEIEKADFWGSNYACNRGRVMPWTGGAYHIGVAACRVEQADTAWRYLEYLLKGNAKPNGLISHNGALLADASRSEANIRYIPDAELNHDLDPEPLKAAEIMNGRLTECTTEDLDCRDTMFPAQEGPACYLLMIGEMLVQGQNGVVRVFPALPSERDAAFVDLRVEGPMLVSSQRLSGEVTFVRLRALAPVSCRLRSPWSQATVWRSADGEEQEAAELANDRHLKLNMAAGQELVFAPDRRSLTWQSLMRPRQGESAQARHLTFDDGMMVWVGKEEPDDYYRALRAARGGCLSREE